MPDPITSQDIRRSMDSQLRYWYGHGEVSSSMYIDGLLLAKLEQLEAEVAELKQKLSEKYDKST